MRLEEGCFLDEMMEAARWRRDVAWRYAALLKEYATLAGVESDPSMMERIRGAEQKAQEVTQQYEAVSKRAVQEKKTG